MIKIGITSGLRGTFAVMYDENGPIQSGIGSYKNASDPNLRTEVCGWIVSEDLPCRCCYYELTCKKKLERIRNG